VAASRNVHRRCWITQRATAAGARATFNIWRAGLARAALGFALHLMTGSIISHRAAVVSFLVLGILISLQAQLSVRNIFRRDFRCFRNGLPKTRFSQPGSFSERWIADRAEISCLDLARDPAPESAAVRGCFGRLRSRDRTFLSGLIAPVMMIFNLLRSERFCSDTTQAGRFNAVTTCDTSPGTDPQIALPTSIGLAMALSAYVVSLPLLPLDGPVILGLWLRHSDRNVCSRVFGSNSDCSYSRTNRTPRLLVRANELASAPHEHAAPRSSNCETTGNSWRTISPICPMTSAASAARSIRIGDCTRKIEEAETFDEVLGYLKAREAYAVLHSPTLLRAFAQCQAIHPDRKRAIRRSSRRGCRSRHRDQM